MKWVVSIDLIKIQLLNIWESTMSLIYAGKIYSRKGRLWGDWWKATISITLPKHWLWQNLHTFIFTKILSFVSIMCILTCFVKYASDLYSGSFKDNSFYECANLTYWNGKINCLCKQKQCHCLKNYFVWYQFYEIMQYKVDCSLFPPPPFFFFLISCVHF